MVSLISFGFIQGFRVGFVVVAFVWLVCGVVLTETVLFFGLSAIGINTKDVGNLDMPRA